MGVMSGGQFRHVAKKKLENARMPALNCLYLHFFFFMVLYTSKKNEYYSRQKGGEKTERHFLEQRIFS